MNMNMNKNTTPSLRRWFQLALVATALSACAGGNIDVAPEEPGNAYQGGPLEILSPKPGAQLEGDGSPTQPIRIRTHGLGDRPQVYVNGQPATPEPDGEFLGAIEPRFGINHVRISASNGQTGEEFAQEYDVLWAPAYLKNEKSPLSFQLDQACTLRLGQRFFDDHLPAVEDADKRTVTRDLADLLSLLLRHGNPIPRLPNPLVSAPGLTFQLTSLDLSQAQTSLDLTATGLSISVEIPDLGVGTQGAFDYNQVKLDLSGKLTASIAARVRVDFQQDPAGGMGIQVPEAELAFYKLSSRFESAEADALFELGAGLLRTTLEKQLSAVLKKTLDEALQPVVANLWQSLNRTLLSQTLSMPAIGGAPQSMRFSATIGALTLTERESLSANLGVSFGLDGPGVHPDARGVPLSSDGRESALFQTSRVQVAMRLALLNGVLQALWNAGELEMDLSDALPPEVRPMLKRVRLSSKLPPVARPPLAGNPSDLRLEVGQMEVILDYADTVDPTTDTIAVNLATGIRLDLTPEAIRIGIDEKPELHIWVLSFSGPRPHYKPEFLEDVITSLLWTQLRAKLQKALAFPLPVPSLGKLDLFDADLANLKLSLEKERAIETGRDLTVIDFALIGSLQRK